MMMRTKKGSDKPQTFLYSDECEERKLYTRDSRDSIELVKTIHHVVEREG